MRPRRVERVLVLALTSLLFHHPSTVAQTGPTPVNLEEAVRMAVAFNPELRAARSRVESARARAGQAGYLEDPEVTFQAWGVPLNQPLRFQSANPLIFGVRQKVPFFGKRGLREAMAGEEVRIAEAELRAKEREVVARVKSAYAELFMAHKNLEVTQELADLVEQMRVTAEALYQVGRSPQQDVIRALVEQTDLLNKRSLAERELITSQARLNVLLNRSPVAALPRPQELSPTPVTLRESDIEKLALEQRPELRAQESGIQRSERAIDLAKRDRRVPDFMVGVEYWLAPEERPRHMYTSMLTLTVPFSPWTKGRHDLEVEEAMAERAVAKSNFDAVKNMTLFEVRDLLAKLEAGRRSLSVYQDGLLPQAEQSFQSAMAAYQTGRANFGTLLEAQRTIRDARLGYTRALVEHEQSLADLERAVGKELF